MPEPRAIWAGPGALRALAAGGEGTVEIALHPGGYVRLEPGGWLLVAHDRAPRGPLTLVVTGLERAPLVAGPMVRVEGDELVVSAPAPPAREPAEPPRLAGRPLNAAGSPRFAGPPLGPPPRRARPPLDPPPLRISLAALGDSAPAEPSPLAPGWPVALSAALDAAPTAPDDFAGGLAALRRGHHDVAVAELAGRGPGLTPAGDDVLAGYAAWRHAEGASPRLASPRCSPIGRAYLDCAERGELPELAERVLRAIRAGDSGLARRRSRALAGWGASSGAAILWGVAAGASS